MSVLQSPTRAEWTLPRLLGDLWADAPELAVSTLSSDSREVEPGTLFLALRGAVHDGRAFLAQAAESGAVAALVEDELPAADESAAVPLPFPVKVVPELRRQMGAIASRFFGRPSSALHIAAVTGTNGKTTVSQLLAQIIRAGGYDCGVIGTLGVTLDGSVAPTTHTTPDAIALHGTLAAWVAGAVPFVTMEASSHALDQGRMGAVEVDTAIFTNLTRDHLDYHGTMEAYGAAKARLFSQPGLRTAVLNADDPFSSGIAGQLAPEVNCVRYSLQGAEAELRLSNMELDQRGLRARLHSSWGNATLRCPLLGHFNAANLAAALAAALTAGLPLDAVIAAAAKLVPVPGRMEPVRIESRDESGPLVVVDYAHTPDALTQVLKALRDQTTGRLIAVFGCGGDRDRGKRAEMARAVSGAADHAVITSDNPRSEDPLAIIADVEVAMTGSFLSLVDRAEAIRAAISEAGPDDCVLIAGKGHEDYQIVGDQRLDFSDRVQAQQALRERAA